MDSTDPIDDIAASFQIENEPVRGRIVRLGPNTVDPILRRHDYPEPVAALVGEAVALVALIGSALKIDGRMILQAEGDGPVSFVVAEYRADAELGGGVRGYAKLDKDKFAARFGDNPPYRASIKDLLGEGAFSMTLDQGDDMEKYQGISALEGESLSDCAENYFFHSEQIPTRIKLAIAEVLTRDAPPQWRAGAALLQRVAEDDARGSAEAAWEEALIKFDTTGADELTDPTLTADRLLYRLFHEQGVRLAIPHELTERCTCDRDRLIAILSRFSDQELADMREADGHIHARCEFCGRTYDLGADE
ncbi:MAG: Hsp33 family molecular chaperone [Caulobacterales bacterium]